MIRCNQCGRCCWYLKNGKYIKCKHLIKYGKKTLCRVYPTRLGRILDKNIKCVLRADDTYDYVDCPYNTDKPICDVWGELK